MRKSQLSILILIIALIFIGIRNRIPSILHVEVVEVAAPEKTISLITSKKADRTLASNDIRGAKKYSFTELHALVDNDEICKVMELKDISLSDKLSVSIGTYDESDPFTDSISNVLHILYAPNDELLKSPFKVTSANESLSLILALKLSNLMEGDSSTTTDYRRSKELLNDLKSKDADNSFYSYFLVAVMEKLGAHDWEIKAEFEEAFKRRYFNSTYNGMIVGLNNHLLNNASRYYLLQEVVSSMPVPMFNPSARLLKNLIDQNDSNFNQSALTFCKSMMVAGEDNKANGKGGVFNAMEYAFGRNCYQQAWNKIHPGTQPPSSPTFSELLKDQIENQDRMLKIFNNLNENLSTCPRSELDQELEKARNAFYGKYD